jgi:hypothetical protein
MLSSLAQGLPATVTSTVADAVGSLVERSAGGIFLLAVEAMLLIPIGRRGIPQGADRYGHDQDF